MKETHLKNMIQDTVSDEETKKVIADFLELGHVENIIAMFQHDPTYYSWVGELLVDQRLNVRLGLFILFEELKLTEPKTITLAINSLLPILHHEEPLFRGEALSLLGIIGDPLTIPVITRALDDPSPQVREMAAMVLDEIQ